MKIKVVHDACGREVMVRQILESGGHCPWDGKPFNKDYTANLAEALEIAENAGSALEDALERIAGIGPSFVIERASLVGPIERQVGRLEEAAGAVRR